MEGVYDSRKCHIYSLFLLSHCRGSPAAEEAEYFVLVIALALFEEAGVLRVQDFSVIIKYHKNGKPETCRICKAVHQRFALFHTGLVSLAGIVVHMDVNEVFIYHLAYRTVIAYIISKAQAPRAPIATDLAYHKFTLGFCLGDSLVYLLNGIEALVIDLFQL